jgi:hypothetical protein
VAELGGALGDPGERARQQRRPRRLPVFRMGVHLDELAVAAVLVFQVGPAAQRPVGRVRQQGVALGGDVLAAEQGLPHVVAAEVGLVQDGQVARVHQREDLGQVVQRRPARGPSSG